MVHQKSVKGLGREGCNGLLVTAGADGMIRISMIGEKKLAGPTIMTAMRENPMLKAFADFAVNGPSVESQMIVTDNQPAGQELPSEDEPMTVHTPGVTFDASPESPLISEEESQAIEAEMTNT